MIIKRFESFSQDLPYEKKTPKDWKRNRTERSVDLDLDVIFEIADYFIWNNYIRVQNRRGGNQSFRKDEIGEIKQFIGDDKIFCFYLDWTFGFFKDDDEWWWFRRNDEIFRCDELSGLKVLLDDLGYSKKSKNI
jgi:hypothetical protein